MISKKMLMSLIILAVVAVVAWQTKNRGTPSSKVSESKDSTLATNLTIYTARNEELLLPVLKAYEEESGVKIQLLTDQAPALIQRLKAEGPLSSADLFLTVDAGNLWLASREKLLIAVPEGDDLEKISQNIPLHLRDPQNEWFGLSLRARTIIYNSQTVNPEELSTYEALAEPTWKGRLCLRTSQKVYNQSLVAMFIAEWGMEKTASVVRGWVDNLAQPVFANDSDLVKAVAAGTCQVGIVNTYYLGRELKAEPSLPVKIFWANQESTGVHINISGMGLVKSSKNLPAATKFLVWLSEVKAQEIFAEANLEYPANPRAKSNTLVDSWGPFTPSKTHLGKSGELQAEAVMLMDRSGYK